MSELFEPTSSLDRRLALGATGDLDHLNRAGLLTAADIHVASRIAQIITAQDGATVSDLETLTVALAVRAVREGSTALDPAMAGELLTAARAATADGPAADHPSHDDLVIPEPALWLSRMASGSLAKAGVVVVEHGLIYLERYAQEEAALAGALLARLEAQSPALDEVGLTRGLRRVFDDAEDVTGEPSSWREQRDAVRQALRQRTMILTGGPGTGKTSTVAALLALFSEQMQEAGEIPRIALAAPTGKAAARLTEAVREATQRFAAEDRMRVCGLEASTLHRLLGWQRNTPGQFRHHAGNPLPHDLVVVDEASMLSLNHAARLLDAVRPRTRLVLVGDPDQLASVEAGVVLGDLVAGFEDLRRAGTASPVFRLETAHRFHGAIADLADAIRDADADRALDVLHSGDELVEFIEVDDARAAEALLRPRLLEHAVGLREAARRGDAPAALTGLGRHRLLCAHREGPAGVALWNRLVERWLSEQSRAPLWSSGYLGRPVLVTHNDYTLGLFNGDTGVVIRGEDGHPTAVFGQPAAYEGHAVSRLADIETMHAMTIHKSQGGQARQVTVILPDQDSPLLTKELIYTAVTRAQEQLTVVGSESSVRAAIARPVRRATGLRRRLAPLPD